MRLAAKLLSSCRFYFHKQTRIFLSLKPNSTFYGTAKLTSYLFFCRMGTR
jgi:hypothetical protein